ncbi:hypothetical protein PSEUDO8BK_10778 [Pseudomonas sp. 8BK]|nr:hypothetical protein PSEUDO8BK_10778 [Pseudomonas sp. 8BK]
MVRRSVCWSVFCRGCSKSKTRRTTPQLPWPRLASSALGETLKAEEEYQALSSDYAGSEAAYRYAVLLRSLGRQREAREMQQ